VAIGLWAPGIAAVAAAGYARPRGGLPTNVKIAPDHARTLTQAARHAAMRSVARQTGWAPAPATAARDYERAAAGRPTPEVPDKATITAGVTG